MHYYNLLDAYSKSMYSWAKKLWPLNRSLTGNDNLKTLNFIKEILSDLTILSAKSGKKIYDWRIPSEWNIKDAFIEGEDGKKICEFKKNNLHIVGYSESVNKTLSLKDLKKNLYTLKNHC